MNENLRKVIKPVYNLGKETWYGITGFFYGHGMFLDDNFKKLASYRNRHKGERCFLIGTGPSLKAEDLEKIKNEYSIGCNMLYKLYDQTAWRPTYYCMTDRVYAKHQSPEMVKYVDVPIFTPRSTYKRMAGKSEHMIYVNDIYDYETYKIRGKMLSYCWLKASVMLFMMELAVYMGFSEIYLLGVDCTNTYTANGHFTKDYMKEDTKKAEDQRMKRDLKKKQLTPEEMGLHNYRRSIEAYGVVNEFAKAHHVHIYNATRGGDLEVFPRVVLENIEGI